MSIIDPQFLPIRKIWYEPSALSKTVRLKLLRRACGAELNRIIPAHPREARKFRQPLQLLFRAYPGPLVHTNQMFELPGALKR